MLTIGEYKTITNALKHAAELCDRKAATAPAGSYGRRHWQKKAKEYRDQLEQMENFGDTYIG